MRNVVGTVANSFTVGQAGATFHQGTTVPATNLGENGDLYLRHGGSPDLYWKVLDTWINIDHNTATFTRGTVMAGTNVGTVSLSSVICIIRSQYTVDNIDITVDSWNVKVDAAPLDTTYFVLPDSVEGRSIIIKDETGRPDIREVQISHPDLIDGAPYLSLTTERAFIEMIFTNGAWHVIGRG
jgi:hypothetical protein